MTRESAELLAVQALTFLAQDVDRLGAFMAQTGIAPTELRTAARETGFLAGILDHIAADEPLLIEFAGHLQVRPEDVMAARRALGGHNWERDVP